MKIASLKCDKNGKICKDGSLIYVSNDLKRYSYLSDHKGPNNFQSLLDDYKNYQALLASLDEFVNDLNNDDKLIHSFEQRDCHSPLPRAYQWADGSAYVNHVELVRKARGAKMPESFWHDPLIYQGGSDNFIAPHDDILLPDDNTHGIDLEAELAIITDFVPMGINEEDALDKILFVMLVNDVSLRGLIPGELAKGFGFFQSKPASSFSPVAVHIDYLKKYFNNGVFSQIMKVDINDTPFGRVSTSTDVTFNFGQLIAHAAKTRNLCAGTIIGSGTISNKLNDGPGKTIAEGGAGYCCIAEQRMIETIETNAAKTEFLKFGDRVKIWMDDDDGNSIFGEINQKVSKYEYKG